MISRDLDFSKSIEIFFECWESAKSKFAFSVGVAVLSFVLHKFVSVFPLIGFILAPVVATLLYAGVLRITKKIKQSEPVKIDELFYYFKMVSERRKYVNLGLVLAFIIFLTRMVLISLSFLNPFVAGTEYLFGFFESFVLFLVGVLMLPEMVYRGLDSSSAYDRAIGKIKTYWPFFLSLFLINWIFVTISLLLFVVPFFIIYLPTVLFLPYILDNKMKITIY